MQKKKKGKRVIALRRRCLRPKEKNQCLLLSSLCFSFLRPAVTGRRADESSLLSAKGQLMTLIYVRERLERAETGPLASAWPVAAGVGRERKAAAERRRGPPSLSFSFLHAIDSLTLILFSLFIPTGPSPTPRPRRRGPPTPTPSSSPPTCWPEASPAVSPRLVRFFSSIEIVRDDRILRRGGEEALLSFGFFAHPRFPSYLPSPAVAPIERVKLLLQTQDSNPRIKSGEIPRYTGIANW